MLKMCAKLQKTFYPRKFTGVKLIVNCYNTTSLVVLLPGRSVAVAVSLQPVGEALVAVVVYCHTPSCRVALPSSISDSLAAAMRTFTAVTFTLSVAFTLIFCPLALPS